MRGRARLEATGERGFGYDPIFVPAGWDETMAELTDAAEGPHQPPGQGVPRRSRSCSPRPEAATAGSRTRLKVPTSSVEASDVEQTTAAQASVDRRVLRSTRGFFDGKSPLLVAVLGLAFIAVVSGAGLPHRSPALAVAALPDADRAGDVEPRPPLGCGRRRDRHGRRPRERCAVDALDEHRRPSALLERHRAVRRVPRDRDAPRHAALDHRCAVGPASRRRQGVRATCAR